MPNLAQTQKRLYGTYTHTQVPRHLRARRPRHRCFLCEYVFKIPRSRRCLALLGLHGVAQLALVLGDRLTRGEALPIGAPEVGQVRLAVPELLLDDGAVERLLDVAVAEVLPPLLCDVLVLVFLQVQDGLAL